MNGGRADRNLLFGILAVQLDFVSRDALIAAMNIWVLAKERQLGDILVEQGTLAGPRRSLLETLVEEHLREHGGDVERSLMALPALTPVCVALQDVADGDVRQTLACLSPTPTVEGNDPWATSAYTPPPAAPGARFQLLRLHAKGGLGQVHVALDRELNRQVALKEIQNQHADDPGSRERFVLEAEITGGLEHPGIVPVYGMGRHPDGRPYYAMRFVKGASLRDAIKDFHGKEQGRRPLEGVAFRKLLARFLAVCDAVAYAHSRGVLHRDLKPANVMLGPYGETLVVDWGLAKPVVSRQLSAVNELARSASEGPNEAPLWLSASGERSSTLTLPGSVLGTPAYMSPEQAEGRLDQLGPPSDVYGLGATLYCLLTGKAPFAEEAHQDVLRKVQRGEFPPPRQANPRVPAALEAVCLKAMAQRPADRYPTARALAEDVEHWLADEPVRVYAEPMTARARRWARRHKPLVTALAALVGTALLLGGIGLGWWLWQRAETAELAARNLGDAQEALKKDNRAEALQALDRAETRLHGGGPAALIERLQRLRKEWELLPLLEEARLWRANVRDGRPDYAGADSAYARAFGYLGLNVAALGPEETAQRIRDSSIPTHLVAALDDWAFVREMLRGDREALLAAADRADDDSWRRRLRELVAQRDRTTLERLAESMGDDQPPANVQRLARALKEVASSAAAERLLRAAQRRHPNDFWLNFDLAEVLLNAKPANPSASLGFLRAALTLRPGDPTILNSLGVAFRKLGAWQEATDALNAAIVGRPEAPAFHFNLANVWLDQNKSAEAEKELRTAVALDPAYAEAHWNLGLALQKQKHYAEGLVEYREGHRLGWTKPDWPIRSEMWVRFYELQERMARLLPQVESGQVQPANAADRAELGFFCMEQEKRTATAVRFYEQAFAEEPALAAAINSHRYNAACAAALAGCGQGKDAAGLDAKERDRLRERARTWLREELEVVGSKLAKREPDDVAGILTHWQQDPDLTGVRDPRGLDELDEKQSGQWHGFWKEVRGLQRRASAKK